MHDVLAFSQHLLNVFDILGQHYPEELSAVVEISVLCTVHYGATTHMWLLSTSNVKGWTEVDLQL